MLICRPTNQRAALSTLTFAMETIFLLTPRECEKLKCNIDVAF